MTIKLDFNDVFEGGIKDGDYEVVITKAEEDATPSGSEHVDMRLTIRNDVQQAHQNQIIFHKLWKAKATGTYNMRMFNTLGQAAGLESGKTYQNFEELLKDFLGKPMKVRVKNEQSEYNGQVYENLNVKMTRATDFPNVQHQFKEGFDTNTSSVDSPPENLPF